VRLTYRGSLGKVEEMLRLVPILLYEASSAALRLFDLRVVVGGGRLRNAVDVCALVKRPAFPLAQI
jgi:hypothetical protein